MAVAYIALSSVDVFAIYNEIRSVVFSSLNLERGAMVANAYVAGQGIPAPNEVSKKERIFFNPEAIDTAIFRTVSQTGCSLEDMHRLRREAFVNEKFLITWSPLKGASIVLHDKANHNDILRALLAWAYFMNSWQEEEKLRKGPRRKIKTGAISPEEEAAERERLFSLLKQAHEKARREEDSFIQALGAKGWDMRHTVFGKIKKRTDW